MNRATNRAITAFIGIMFFSIQPSAASQPDTVLALAAGNESDQQFYYGRLGDYQKLYAMKMVNVDGVLSGAYLYLDHMKRIDLVGEVGAKHTNHITEFVEDRVTVYFEMSPNYPDISGVWRPSEKSEETHAFEPTHAGLDCKTARYN